MSFIGSWIGGALGYVSGFIYSTEVKPEIHISMTPHSMAILPENCILSTEIEKMCEADYGDGDGDVVEEMRF